MAFLLLTFIIIALFFINKFKNNKGTNWNELLRILTLNQYAKRDGTEDDTHRIPGPLRLPIIGTKWNLWFMKLSKLHEYYGDMHKKYGDVVVEYAGNFPLVSLYNREDIDQVLKYPSKYPFRPPNEIVSVYRLSHPERYQTVGLVNAQGEEWAQIRSNIVRTSIQNRKFLSSFFPELNRICDDFVDKMKSQRNDENVVDNVDLLLKSTSFESASCFILGKSKESFMKIGPNKFSDITNAANNIFKCMRDAYYGTGLWKYFPTKVYKDYARNEEILYNEITNIIDEAMQEEESNLDGKQSIMKTVLKLKEVDEREKISGIIDMITGGIELFPHAVSFLLYYISTHPEVQEKIVEESMDMSDELTLDDLSRAFYTRAALHEAFRLCPSAFAIARILEKEFEFSGYKLKPGTVVVCQTMIACTNEENFKDASEYKPERWLKENGEFDSMQCVGSSIVLPFGCGKRICPGKKYVELELMILLIKIVRSFKVKYTSEFRKQFEFVIAAKSPVNVQFSDRT